MSVPSAFAQCPQPSFTLPDTVCTNEPFSITNTTIGATRYEWDFCSGDLAEKPEVSELVTIPEANIPTNITTITDGTNWFSFFISRDNNVLFRLDFGNNLNNTPTVVNVGHFGAVIQRAEPIKFIKEGSNWYAFTVNSFGNSNLIRLNFGASLTNTPTVTDLTNLGGKLNTPRGLELVLDNGSYTALVTNAGDHTLTLISFGNSVTNTIPANNVLKTPAFSGTDNELISTAIIKNCNQWYGVTASNTNGKIFRLDFGDSIFKLPSITDISANLPFISTPFNVVLAEEESFYAFIETFTGNLIRLDFGKSMNNNSPQFKDWGNYRVLKDIAGFSLTKTKSAWIGFVAPYYPNKIYRINFPNPCSLAEPLSESNNPPALSYSIGGLKRVFLRAYNSVGESKAFAKEIFVRPRPTADFASEGSPPVFKAIVFPGEKIKSWLWEFEDGYKANGQTIQRNFTSNGIFNVKLTVESVCGQVNSVSKPINIGNNTVLNCPLSSFSIPDTICANEALKIINTSVAASQYEWDFCSGDLEKQPVSEISHALNATAVPTDVTNVFDGTNWFGFVSSRDNNKIFRLDYGNSLDNTPAIIDLGNPNGLLSRPEQMKFMKVNGEWIALVVNVNNFTSGFFVVKLDFGNSLTNTPIASRISALDTYLSLPRGIELVYDGTDLLAFIANTSNNTVTIANFGSSFHNTLSLSAIKNITLPRRTSGHNVMGISVIKQCDQWYGLAVSYSNRIYKLDFGKDLFSDPIINEITTIGALKLSHVKVALTLEGGNYYGLIMNANGRVLNLNFGSDLSNNTPKITSDFNVVGSFVGMELTKFQSSYWLYTIDWSEKRILKFTFPNTCSSSVLTSSSDKPTNIVYSKGGVKKITLIAYDSDNNVSVFSDSVFVRPAVTADFTATYLCVGATKLSAIDAPVGNKIMSWTWELAGERIGNTPTVDYPFPGSGIYPVTLIVEDICGNRHRITRHITIYKKSTADFIAPTQKCSNSEIAFIDNSTVADDEIVAWKWNFGDGNTSTKQHPVYSYTKWGMFELTLTITGKSGCSVSISKAMEIKPGAAVDFLVENPCIDNQTVFSDQTVYPEGVVLESRLWNFGDSNTSTEQHPVHQYEALGNYKVTLTIKNSLGCETKKTKFVTIYKLPTAAFSYSLACAGEPVSFSSDESASAEGVLAQWNWNFDDPKSGTNNSSIDRNPAHTFSKPGTYRVKLKVLTIYGCTDSLVKEVTVLSNPTTDFTCQVNCLTKEVSFTDQSIATDNTITSWFWDFGDNQISDQKNPVHTYTQAKIYKVTLFTTSSNFCTSSTVKEITIYSPPAALFEVSGKLCVNNTLTFTDKSKASTTDPIISWHWSFGSWGESTDRNPEFTFSATDALTVPVSLTITTASGCIATITEEIALEPLPQSHFSYKPSSDLTPLEIAFTNTSSADAVSFAWDLGDGTQSTQRNPIHTYSASGNYEVSLTAINASGCIKTYTEEIKVSSISGDFDLKLDSVVATTTGNATLLALQLLNNSSQLITSLRWQATVVGQNQFHYEWKGALQPGKVLNYTFDLPIGENNKAIICVKAIELTSNKASNEQCIGLTNQLAVANPYPNPTSGIVNFSIFLPEVGKMRITIIDALGKVAHTITTQALPAGINDVTYDTKQLAKGMYGVIVEIGSFKMVKKLVVR